MTWKLTLAVICITGVVVALVCAFVFQERLDRMKDEERNGPEKLSAQDSWNAAVEDIERRERGGRWT